MYKDITNTYLTTCSNDVAMKINKMGGSDLLSSLIFVTISFDTVQVGILLFLFGCHTITKSIGIKIG